MRVYLQILGIPSPKSSLNSIAVAAVLRTRRLPISCGFEDAKGVEAHLIGLTGRLFDHSGARCVSHLRL